MRYGLVVAVGVAVLGSGGPAAAQPPGPPRGGAGTPTYSPYLNLLRQGNSPAVNYYGLVRPAFQSRESIQALQSQVSMNQQSIGNLAGSMNDPQRPSTDKAVSFMNYGGYFQNYNPGIGGGGGGSGVGFGTIGGAGGRGGVGGGAIGGGGRPAGPPRR